MTEHTSNPLEYNSGAGDPVGYTDDGQPVVAEPGDGQLSDLDIERDLGPEERVIPFKSARTTFPAREAEDTEKWDRLWELQHQWDSDDTGRRTFRDKLNISKALANALGLSGHQKDRVIGIVINTTGRRFNQIGGVEALALGAIAYVGEQDAEDIDDRILGSEEFEEICDQHGVDGWAACRKVKEIYREKSALGATV